MEKKTIKDLSVGKMTGDIIKESYPVLGMTCAGCAASVESMLKSTKGVLDASVNYASQKVQVEYNPNEAKPLDLQNSLRSVGYDIIINTEDPSAEQENLQHKNYQELKLRTIRAAILTIPVVIIGMFFMGMPYGDWISLVLTAPVVFYYGRNFFINAYKKAIHKQFNMDTLVAMSTGVAFVFSTFNTIYPEFWLQKGLHAHVYFEAASVIIVFISLGKLLEERAKSNTSSAIKKMMGLQPKTANIKVEGEVQEILIAQVQIGNIVVVKPGERIPVDGIVLTGHSFINESTITGEPLPVEKKQGDKVFAGTINQKGSFEFSAEKLGADTILAHIIKMVQEAQGSKAPVQKIVDKIAGIFVPVVLLIAALTFAVWMIFGGENAITHALLNSITVLVIACPCALGLATPTAIMVGVGKGAENNILIKDAESLELGDKVNAVILDKTGTITEGKPTVTDLVWDVPEEKMLALKAVLYSMESQSEHPLGDAVVARLKESGITTVQLDHFTSITGKGVSALYLNEKFFAGNSRLLTENGVSISDKINFEADKLRSEAKTVVYFSDSKKAVAVLAIADKIKPTSAEAIEVLHKQSVDVYMLTGDSLQTAEAVAKQVGIKEFKAEMLPSEKADFIKKLQQEGKVVAMVGDGINDSHALAQADVSIAMGKGSDIAMDVAKITLITSDLKYVSKALKLSSKTVRGIKQNLFWAFIYNLIGIPIAAGVLYPINGFLLDPMIAGAAMALSSVSVVTNSLRLKNVKI